MFLPGLGDKLYLPSAVENALKQILDMKIRGKIDLNHFDLITLNAVRTHGYYGANQNRVVDIVLTDEPESEFIEHLTEGLEGLQVVNR